MLSEFGGEETCLNYAPGSFSADQYREMERLTEQCSRFAGAHMCKRPGRACGRDVCDCPPPDEQQTMLMTMYNAHRSLLCSGLA